MPLIDHPTPSRRRWPAALAFVLVAIAFVLITGLLDGGKGVLPSALWIMPDWAHWWSAPLRMFCNALPGLMLAGLVLALSRRIGLAVIVGLAVEVLIYVVSALKLKNLGAPLMPADFLMLGQLASGGTELLAAYLPQTVWPWLAIAGFIVIVVALVRYERPVIGRRWWVRAPVAAVLIGALVSLIGGWSAWNSVYNGKRLGIQPWSPTATAKHTGLISELALFHLRYGGGHDKPDVPAALALMGSLEDKIHQRNQAIAAQKGPKPDIIVILSESLFDPTILDGYGSDVDFLPNLHRLARHGISGAMYPPTFGGGTIRTGFEVMTGLSLRYFPDIQFPWLQIHEPAISGVVRLLKSRGYSAIAVHGNTPAFWNRTSAFKALGFDRFVSIDDFPPGDSVNDGKYMSDKSFTDELLRQLKPDGPPQFIYGLSIEAHGPYNQTFGINTKVRDAIPVPDTIQGDHRTHLQNYIYHIRHADKQLGRLIKALNQRKRRTIVVFFGDHLPALVAAFQDAGFKNGKDFFFQQVPYLIYDTGHPSAKPVKRDVAAWMLPGMALAQAGIGHTPYYALTDIVGPKLAQLTRAPDAPRPKPTAEQKQIENGLRGVARLRLEGKLEPLWAKATPPRADDAPSTPTTAHTAKPSSGHTSSPVPAER